MENLAIVDIHNICDSKIYSETPEALLLLLYVWKFVSLHFLYILNVVYDNMTQQHDSSNTVISK